MIGHRLITSLAFAIGEAGQQVFIDKCLHVRIKAANLTKHITCNVKISNALLELVYLKLITVKEHNWDNKPSSERLVKFVEIDVERTVRLTGPTDD